MTEVDEIEMAASAAEAETGVRGAASKVPLCLGLVNERHRRWTAAEDVYVRENHGRLSEEAIAANLGRTVISLHSHITRELHLVAPSKAPDILTGEQVAWGLGVDGKSVHMLMDRGLMPCRRLPMQDVNRVIGRQVLLRWLIEPAHWIYFKPERVGAMRPRGNRVLSQGYDFAFWEEARDLVMKNLKEWTDEWLTPGQVARLYGHPKLVGSRYVNKAILRGNLKATRWGNWRILKSDLPARDLTINYIGEVVPALGWEG